MTAAEIRTAVCPKCGSGVSVGYTDAGLLDGMRVICVGFPSCDFILHYDGLAAPPSWLNTLPRQFVTDGTGNITEVPIDQSPVAKFRTGSRVKVTRNGIQTTGLIRDVIWNFSKQRWDYLLRSDSGEPIKLRFLETEIDQY